MPKLTSGQLSTVSPEAQKTLKGIRFFDIPNFIPIPNRMIIRMRNQFQSGEDKVETGLLNKYQLANQTVHFNQIEGQLIQGNDTNTDGPIIFNVHGGGFIMGTARERNAILAAAETKLPVYSVEYTDSPEASYPTPVNEVFTFYKSLVEKFPDRPVVIMGSSAGSTLAAAVINRAHQANIKLPNVAILYCPALDISGNGDSATFNNRRDLAAAHLALRLAQSYIGDADATDPGVSPLYAEIGDWFPATFMSTGTRDIMLSNVLRFTDKLRAANVPTTSVIKEGMWHGFTWEDTLPEAVETRQQAWKFMNEYIN